MEFPYKVLAVVKFNDNEALVLDKLPELKYQLSNRCITGTDGLFAKCLYYEAPFGRFKAFAGCEFEINLADGSVVKCNGQYWDGIMNEHIKVLGFNPGRITVNSIDALKTCYVFTGYYANLELINQLRTAYDGKVWEYREYEKHIKGKEPIIL